MRKEPVIGIAKPFLRVRTFYEHMYGVTSTPYEIAGKKLSGITPDASKTFASPSWREVAEYEATFYDFEGPESAFKAANEAAHELFMKWVGATYPRDHYDVSRMNGTEYVIDSAATFYLVEAWLKTFLRAGGKAINRIHKTATQDPDEIIGPYWWRRR